MCRVKASVRVESKGLGWGNGKCYRSSEGERDDNGEQGEGESDCLEAYGDVGAFLASDAPAEGEAVGDVLQPGDGAKPPLFIPLQRVRIGVKVRIIRARARARVTRARARVGGEDLDRSQGRGRG